ncbi:putative Ig domain-containing protein [Empedobacter sp. 225-1]|uniref:Ig domain-containing protein n=1 Tax=unclassified Empedobacter TaxID=2643773 RepID=UPI0025761099|nr:MULTISPECIES: Ig domain-containing protein [unclassified Empedobacter]MDM1523492.1 putative Ig domain-containing protein [Empedobacter sp. 225-1]MDM1543509.1 putative Ig domain-containing protein [Empedobacter sp. 189-2]
MKKIYLFNRIFLLIGLVSFTAFGQTVAYEGNFGNATLQSSYTADITLNLQSKQWFASYRYHSVSDFRLGNNASAKVPTKFIQAAPQGASIEMLWDIENVKTISLTTSTTYGTIQKWYIFESVDQGNSWQEVASQDHISNAKWTYTASSTKSLGTRYAFIVTGTSNPRVRLTDISITTEVPTNFPPIVSSKTITGTYGVLLSDGTVTATGNPTSWTQTGTLPLGITFDNGVFSGTPEQAGTFTTQVTATNGHGTSDPANVTFEIAKANQTVNYTFENLTQDQGTTFAGLPTQTEQGINIVYTSADNSIVSTNGNILSFEGIGSTTITATALSTDNFNEYTTTFDVRANDPNATYCFEETFDGLKGNNTSGNGSNTAWNGNSNFPTTSSAYQAGEAVRLGTSSKTGAITSKTLDEISGNVTVSFDVKGWTSVEGSMNVTLGTETKNVTYIATIANAFENVTVSFDNVAAGSTLKLETSAKRAFIDNVKIQCSATNSSTTWENGAWSNGEPDLTKEAVLKAVPTAGFCAKKLTVENEITIPAGITITVENEVVNNATLRFEHGAYLIQNNNSAVNVGPAMFDRSSTPIYRLENLMWSSPVINQNIFEISPNTLTNRFARFLESTNDWTENVTATDNFKAGELISFRAPNNYNNYGEGDAQVFESSFRGQLFNGEVTIPVTKTSKGNNAVGNPYASPLSLDALIAANTSVGVNSVYVWTHSKPIVNGAYQGSNWAIYNGIGWNDPAMTSPNIDIAQGFIVKVANAGNLVLNNAMRTSANGPVYYKEQKDRYWLSLSNNQGKINSSLIGYVNGSTNKFDQNFDAQPFDNNNEGLYSVLNNDLFVIQGRGDFNNEDSFDLTFNVKKAGTYQINLEKFEGVFENQNIYLVDKKLDKVFNLSELKSYSFDTKAGEINDRFSINYQNKTLSTNDLSKKGLVVYAQNKQITISSKESIKSIKLVDISGRQLQNIQNINTKNYVINLNVNPQVVVVVVENTNGTTESRKVILK